MAPASPVRGRIGVVSGSMGERSLGDKLQAVLPLLRRGLVSDGDAEELFARLRDTIGATGFALGQDLDYRGWGIFRGIPEQWMRDHTRLRGRIVDPAAAPHAARLLVRVAARDRAAAHRPRVRRPVLRVGAEGIALAKLYSPFRDNLFFWMVRTDRIVTRGVRARVARAALPAPGVCAGDAARAGAPRGSAAPAPPSVFVSFPEGAVQADAAARRAIERRTGPLGTIGWQRVTRAIALAAARFTHAAGGRSQTLWPGLGIDFAAMRRAPARARAWSASSSTRTTSRRRPSARRRSSRRSCHRGSWPWPATSRQG